MDRSTPGFPVHHQLPELARSHVHWADEAIQPSISSSVIPFSCFQSFPASGSFLMSRLFASGGQSIGASASVFPMNIQDWFPLGLTDLIPLPSKGLSSVFSNITVQKHQFFGTQPSLCSSSHPYMTTGKTIALTRRIFVGKVMSLLFNMLSRFVIAFLPRSKHLLISWLKRIKSATVSTFSPSTCRELMGLDAMILFYECWLSSQVFTLLFQPHQEAL